VIPGRRVSWLASRYLEQMVQGEIVYFWLAGEAETRGLGRVNIIIAAQL
jgi:hypothetical protein